MTFKIAYDTSYEKVADPDQADNVLDRIMTLYGPDGHRCVIYIATGDSDDPWADARMQVAVDADRGRGFVRWLGDGAGFAYVHDLELLDEDLIFDDDPNEPALPVPPQHTRVTSDVARQVVREFLQSGKRPTSVSWMVEGSQHPEITQPAPGFEEAESGLGVASADGRPGSPQSWPRPDYEFESVSRELANIVRSFGADDGQRASELDGLGVSSLYLPRVRQLLRYLSDGLSKRQLSRDEAARLLLLINHNLTEAATLLEEERVRASQTVDVSRIGAARRMIAQTQSQLTQVGPRIMRLFHDIDDQTNLVSLS